MSHRVHPFAHRLGIIRDWKSRWFSPKNSYKTNLRSDISLREFLDKRYHGMFVSSVDLERGQKTLRIIIETSRPALIIGRSGEGTAKLQSDLVKNAVKLGIPTNVEIKIDIKEVRYPETNARIMAQMIAEGLEKRLPFRRVIKQTLEKIIANKSVLGAKIELSGRLGGAEMSRVEKLRKGRVPLQTLRADVDFTRYEAHMSYGQIGIKVWIYKGDIFDKDKQAQNK